MPHNQPFILCHGLMHFGPSAQYKAGAMLADKNQASY